MPDREKVIRGLEACSSCLGSCPTECPYYSHTLSCTGVQLKKDALALLRERDEGVTPIESTTEQKKFADRIGFAVSEYWCGDCHFNLFNRPKFCPNCGKKVKWDE